MTSALIPAAATASGRITIVNCGQRRMIKAAVKYAYDKGVDALVDEASFRAFDTESPLGRRPGMARKTGELLPISRKIPLSEYAQLRLRGADADAIGKPVPVGPTVCAAWCGRP